MAKSSKTATKSHVNELINCLNDNLADTLDLKLQVKQAHWNIKGENFIALHQLFDEIAGAVEEYADMQAERVVQLGGIAKGTLQAIHAATSLKAYPDDIQRSSLHVAELTKALITVADNTRQLIDTADASGDKVTADLFTEVARGLDKWRWFVEAHK